MKPNKNPEIIYIGDPMCSWCWGFAPVMEQIIANYSDVATIRIIVGGLRPGNSAQELNDQRKDYIRSHWNHVHLQTKQPFNFEFFERENFVYDTEPAAKAVVAVRTLEPQKEFSFFTSLQKAFYVDNIDITQRNSYTPILEEHGIDKEQFMKIFDSESNTQAAYKDFADSRRLGIGGFPSVVLRSDSNQTVLTNGYQPYDNLDTKISAFISSLDNCK